MRINFNDFRKSSRKFGNTGEREGRRELAISKNQYKIVVYHVLTYSVHSPNLDPRWYERQFTPKVNMENLLFSRSSGPS